MNLEVFLMKYVYGNPFFSSYEEDMPQTEASREGFYIKIHKASSTKTTELLTVAFTLTLSPRKLLQRSIITVKKKKKKKINIFLTKIK